jgi:hypothetical protein
MMTTSRIDSAGALYGIAARMRGHVQELPQVRYAADGSELLEFKLKLVDDWPHQAPPANELVTVRFSGQQPELAQWLAFGRHVVCQGTLHLARWTGKQDGVPRAQLLLEATYVEPLDQERPDPKRAAAYAPRPPQPSPGRPPTEAERLERLTAVAAATTVETDKPKRPARREFTEAKRLHLAQKYDAIYDKNYGKDSV